MCSYDFLDIKVYKPSNNRGYRFFLEVTDTFSIYGWTTFLKNK